MNTTKLTSKIGAVIDGVRLGGLEVQESIERFHPSPSVRFVHRSSPFSEEGRGVWLRNSSPTLVGEVREGCFERGEGWALSTCSSLAAKRALTPPGAPAPDGLSHRSGREVVLPNSSPFLREGRGGEGCFEPGEGWAAHHVLTEFGESAKMALTPPGSPAPDGLPLCLRPRWR